MCDREKEKGPYRDAASLLSAAQVAATCIAYRSHEDGSVRRSFTCQFHPEVIDLLTSTVLLPS